MTRQRLSDILANAILLIIITSLLWIPVLAALVGFPVI